MEGEEGEVNGDRGETLRGGRGDEREVRDAKSTVSGRRWERKKVVRGKEVKGKRGGGGEEEEGTKRDAK